MFSIKIRTNQTIHPLTYIERSNQIGQSPVVEKKNHIDHDR